MTILVYCLFPEKFGLLGGPDCGQDTTKHTRISFYASGPSLNIEATDFVFISMNYNADRAGVLEAVVGGSAAASNPGFPATATYRVGIQYDGMRILRQGAFGEWPGGEV